MLVDTNSRVIKRKLSFLQRQIVRLNKLVIIVYRFHTMLVTDRKLASLHSTWRETIQSQVREKIETRNLALTEFGKTGE